MTLLNVTNIALFSAHDDKIVGAIHGDCRGKLRKIIENYEVDAIETERDSTKREVEYLSLCAKVLRRNQRN